MRRGIIKYMMLSLVCVVLTVCCDPQSAQIDTFLSSSDLCVMSQGKAVVSLSEDEAQMGYNNSQKRYWACDDAMNRFYILSLQDGGLGGKGIIRGEVVYSNGSSVYRYNDISFEMVSSRSGDGVTLQYLYSKAQKLGVVVPVGK